MALKGSAVRIRLAPYAFQVSIREFQDLWAYPVEMLPPTRPVMTSLDLHGFGC